MKKQRNRNGRVISLRQLAKEIGVSPSYLSQVKNGKRPASAKVAEVLSNLDLNMLSNVKQSTFDIRGVNYYNFNRMLGNSLAVGQRTLNPSGKVRILLPQPSYLGSDVNSGHQTFHAATSQSA